ncbi:MAG: flagellar basal body-associated FliL family protein [Clostridia bacterium]|nr:flagellar basal body-associated FliL family protein [Clostridia bacterium]
MPKRFRTLLILVLILASWFASGCSRDGAGAPETVEVKDVVTNLADPAHYARLSMVLECRGPGGKRVAKEEAKVRDAVIDVLRRHSVEDMRGDLGPLRKELLAAINKAVGGDYVKAVYFEEFVTQ